MLAQQGPQQLVHPKGELATTNSRSGCRTGFERRDWLFVPPVPFFRLARLFRQGARGSQRLPWLAIRCQSYRERILRNRMATEEWTAHPRRRGWTARNGLRSTTRGTRSSRTKRLSRSPGTNPAGRCIDLRGGFTHRAQDSDSGSRGIITLHWHPRHMGEGHARRLGAALLRA